MWLIVRMKKPCGSFFLIAYDAQTSHPFGKPADAKMSRRLEDGLIGVSDAALRVSSLRNVLEWAAGPNGLLRRDRLERIAAILGYRHAWVDFNTDRDWREVFEEVSEWARQKNGSRD
jgi:hypothetical protein